MKKLLLILLCLLALNYDNSVKAAGQWGCKTEYTTEFTFRCFAENEIFRFLNFQVNAGLDWRFPNTSYIPTPYTSAIWYGQNYFIALEFAKPLDNGSFKFSFSVGGNF